MPTPEQIEVWKAQITKKHYGKDVQCFSCPEIDWGLYEVANRPCVHNPKFISIGFCRKRQKLEVAGKEQSDGYKEMKE